MKQGKKCDDRERENTEAAKLTIAAFLVSLKARL
jgi:hypothetical protein